MAKSRAKSNIGNIASLVAVLLGIAAIVMLFLPAIGITDSDTTYTGMNIAFGYSETVMGSTIEIFAFSFMNLLTYILAAVGVVFTILGLLGKGSRFAAFIAAGAFIVAGVFFLMTITFSCPNEDIESIVGGLAGLFNQSASVKDAFTLGIGSIIGAVVSFLAGIGCLAKVLIK